MIVPSPVFLIFAAIAALYFHLGWLTPVRPMAWRQGVLLAANLIFVASFSFDPLSLAPFAGFLALGYAAYRFTRNGKRANLFVVVVLLTLFAFFWLKRYSFVPSSLYLPFPYLLVGLSYVFFRVLHLIIDGHQEAIEEPVSWLSYLNYTLNFTGLVSGPIQRYEDYRRMEVAPPKLTWVAAGQSIERIVIGYFKVAILSMFLSEWQHSAIDALATDGSILDRIWTGTLIMGIYPFYLYYNFSGYVDVVIGVARFFCIELPENFNRPFSTTNFIAFWGHWHMTLSNWLKTYVYNPLMMTCMTRVTSPSMTKYIAVFAFFVTFFLVGLWHGQTSEFMFFGVLQGGGVAVNKLYQLKMTDCMGRAGYRLLCANPVYVAFCRGMTFTWFAFTLLWFWTSWEQIGVFVANLGIMASVLIYIFTIAVSGLILTFADWLRSALLRVTWSVDPGRTEPVLVSRYIRTAYGTAVLVVTVTIIVLLAAPAPTIVYKAF
jgi:D-alanyl-lipoteichoic acid acyltransferase DltB (MBOAT superfamily)